MVIPAFFTRKLLMLEMIGSHFQNSNFQIEAWVAGKAHTPWEKYRLLCNQLENRQLALSQTEAAAKHMEAKIAKFNHLKTLGIEWEVLEVEAELIEARSNREVGDRCIESARQEVKFIESMIAQLEPQLEATRLQGYTDQQMFQHNQSTEWMAELLHRAENHYISRIFGGFPPDQIDAMRSHPHFESQILPALKQMHQNYLPAIAAANTIPRPPTTLELMKNGG